MSKNLFSLLAGLVYILLVMFFFCANTSASVISYAVVGEKFTAEVQNAPKKSLLSWTITKQGEVIKVEKGSKFSTVFNEKGVYIVRILAEKSDKSQVFTTLTVEVSEKLPNFSPLLSKISSVPNAEQNTIWLSGASENVVFSFLDSTGEVIKYEFEGDIFSDFDADNVIDNDIENKNSPSYLSGGNFSRKYTNNGIPSRARLRVYDDQGNISESYINIRFLEDSTVQQERENSPLKAIVKSLPAGDEDGNIFLDYRATTLLVIGQYSEGKPIEYEIDMDISIDSDGDGNPKNDIDNIGTPSFDIGSSFLIPVDNQKNSQVFQLTVRDRLGKKSIVQKTILFSSSNPTGNSPTVLRPVLFSSRKNIISGETITFKLFNVPEDSLISWDFDSDGVNEISDGKDQQVQYRFAENGEKDITVSILEAGKDPIILRDTVVVTQNIIEEEKARPPVAIFMPEITNNSVYFRSSESHSDLRLANPDLSYSWDFGDGFRAQGPNPIHVYEKEGIYEVILIVEDSVEQSSEIRATIEITSIQAPFDSEQHGGKFEINPQASSSPLPSEPIDTINPSDSGNTPSENQGENSTQTPLSPSLEVPQFVMPWWLLLIVILLSIPFLILIKKKIDEPDKDFSVIIHDFFNGNKKQEVLLEESVEAEIIGEDTQEQVSDIINDTDDSVSTPDWMRTYDDREEDSVSDNTANASESIVENDESIDSSEDIDSKVPELAQSNGPTPDWMQGVDSPFNDDLLDEESDLKQDDSFQDANSQEIVSTQESPSDEDTPFEVEHPQWLKGIKSPESENLSTVGNDGAMDFLEDNSSEITQENELSEFNENKDSENEFILHENEDDFAQEEYPNNTENTENSNNEDSFIDFESISTDNNTQSSIDENSSSQYSKSNEDEVEAEDLAQEEILSENNHTDIDFLKDDTSENTDSIKTQETSSQSFLSPDNSLQDIYSENTLPLDIKNEGSEPLDFLELDEDKDGVANIYNDGTIDDIEQEERNAQNENFSSQEDSDGEDQDFYSNSSENSDNSGSLEDHQEYDSEDEKFLASDATVPSESKNSQDIPSWMKPNNSDDTKSSL